MRFLGKSRLGFYPLPLSEAQRIRKFLQPPVQALSVPKFKEGLRGIPRWSQSAGDHRTRRTRQRSEGEVLRCAGEQQHSPQAVVVQFAFCVAVVGARTAPDETFIRPNRRLSFLDVRTVLNPFNTRASAKGL